MMDEVQTKLHFDIITLTKFRSANAEQLLLRVKDSSLKKVPTQLALLG